MKICPTALANDCPMMYIHTEGYLRQNANAGVNSESANTEMKEKIEDQTFE